MVKAEKNGPPLWAAKRLGWAGNAGPGKPRLGLLRPAKPGALYSEPRVLEAKRNPCPADPNYSTFFLIRGLGEPMGSSVFVSHFHLLNKTNL